MDKTAMRRVTLIGFNKTSPDEGGHMDVFKFLLKRGARVCVALNGSTLLMEAVDKNQTEFVHYLLKSSDELSIDVNHQDKEGNNALFYAVANGNYNVFQTLLNAGCHVALDNHGRTLLMQASLHGHLELVRHVINFSESLAIDIHHRDKDGRNALFYCIENNHYDVMEFLLLSGVKPEQDNCARNNIMQACRSGFMDILQYLVSNSEQLGLDINSTDSNGENALFYAARCNKPTIYQYLLDQGIAVACNKHGISILSQSLHDKKHELTNAILRSGKNLGEAVRGRDVTGKTSFHHFVAMGDIDTLTKLSPYYVTSEDHDSDGVTLLMYSCARAESNQISITRYLIETLHVSVTAIDNKNRDALMHAVMACNYEAVIYLLENTSNLLLADKEGSTVLMIAAANGSLVISEALLQSKCAKDLAIKTDSYGRNAFHYSAMHGKQACLGLLSAYGCDINARDQQGLTPLVYAIRGGHHGMVNALLKRAAKVSLCDSQDRSALHHCFCKPSPNIKCVKELLRFGVDVNHQDNRNVTSLMLACQSCAKTDITIIKVHF